MVQRTPVQIRIDEGRKRRWQDEAEESPDWRSLTDLIVTSVEQMLRRDHYAGGGSDVDLTSVHDRFDNLGEQLDDIEDRLDETYFLVREDESEYTEITARVLDLAPVVDNRDSLLADTPSEDADPEDAVRRTGSVSHLVQCLTNEGYKSLDVKDAVERLSRESSTVEIGYARPQLEEDMRVWRMDA